jgi:hypothetical protein
MFDPYPAEANPEEVGPVIESAGGESPPEVKAEATPDE